MLANHLHPLRDGSEKDEAFLSRARPTKYGSPQKIAARSLRVRVPNKKGIGFFGHITEQASGWTESEAVEEGELVSEANRLIAFSD